MVTENQFEKSYLNLSYDELMSDPVRAQQLLEGSHMFSSGTDSKEAINAWEQQRKFIAEVIEEPGTLLDFGCANGLLLKSLEKWCAVDFTPYGADSDIEALAIARKLFSEHANNFFHPEEYPDHTDLPQDFVNVYWNVWDDFSLEDKRGQSTLEKLLERTQSTGRLIMGFYENLDNNLRKIDSLYQFGYSVEVFHNPYGQEIVAYIDRK